MSAAYRLPRSVWPRTYKVELTADPAWETFSGHVRMDLEVEETTSTIEMHARDLDLDSAKLGDRTAAIEMHGDRETVRFLSDTSIPAGPVELQVSFRGRLNSGMHGLYRAHDGVEVAVASQCEATDARAIFPCFDEPIFKASFQWTVRTSPNAVALANGPLDSMAEEDGRRVWRFAATQPVSSYLAAVTIGRYEAPPAVVSNGTPLRVWALAGKESQTYFAQAFTERLFPWYENYFGVPYPYAKYDQVAVPGFDAGAMENVGLVLFRQNLLLMEQASASWNQEKLIAKVIAHELAHMWFGNLVTMAWWDDLWLNEAFAEWFAHKASDAVAPQYQVWNDFQLDKNRALVDDAMTTTHAVWSPVETPGEALEMFDVITYQKGCAVLRMLECYLGEQAFRTGIRTYMKAFAGRNATGDDLWSHLEESSPGQEVGRMMRSWVEQPGFPLIQLSRVPGGVRLSQARFFANPRPEPNTQRWNVPVTLRFEDREGIKVHRCMLSGAETEERLPAVGELKWVYGNADEVGFYRVHHADGALDQLPLSKLTAAEQMGLLEDQWSLVRNATSEIEQFVAMADRFAASGDHNVLRTLSERLWTLDRMLLDSGDAEARALFQDRLRSSLQPHLDDLGFASVGGEPQDRVQRRAVVLHILGLIAEAPRVVEEAHRRAEQDRSSPRSVDPNLAGTFLNIAARFGDASLYEVWLSTYRARQASTAPPQDALRYLYTLTAFRPRALTVRTLACVLDGTIPQEAIGGLLSQLLGGYHSRLVAWRFLQDEWSALRPRIGDMGISRVVEAVGRLPASSRAEVVDFFKRTPHAGAERALARALAAMDAYEELRMRATPGLLRVVRGGKA